MIIKSHIRGGYRAAAAYMKAIGENEAIRLVQISDPDAKDVDEAFQNIWAVASHTKSTKPLHHISVNPFKDERLTDEQLMKIVERAEQKYGYKHGDHQRVIVEHVKQGRQHFHVFWSRVSLTTGKPVWPGEHWKKSKQICREMERELGLKRPVAKYMKQKLRTSLTTGAKHKSSNRYETLKMFSGIQQKPLSRIGQITSLTLTQPPLPTKPISGLRIESISNSEKYPIRRSDLLTRNQHIAWAWKNKRYDILAMYGIYIGSEP